VQVVSHGTVAVQIVVEDVVEVDDSLWFVVDSEAYSPDDLLDMVQQASNSFDKEND
jgi:hypothetical protein